MVSGNFFTFWVTAGSLEINVSESSYLKGIARNLWNRRKKETSPEIINSLFHRAEHLPTSITAFPHQPEIATNKDVLYLHRHHERTGDGEIYGIGILYGILIECIISFYIG